MEKIRTGLLGSGGAAQIHANALKLCPEREFVGVYSPNPESARKFAQEYGVKAFESKEALFEACDCIHICTPSGMHYENTVECLERGKHVVCEKPVCMNRAECDLLEQAIARSTAKYMPIAQLRTSEGFLRTKQALRDGVFGNIIHATVEMMYYRDPKYYSESSWRGSLRADGGVVMNQGIHGIDLMVGLLGKPVRVWAVSDNLAHAIESPDTFKSFVVFENGCTAQIAVSTAAAPGYMPRCVIFGTNGMVEISEDKIVKWQVNGAPEENGAAADEVKAGMNDPLDIDMSLHAVQFREFSDLIRDGGVPQYTAEEAMTTIRLLDAMFVSARENRIVDLS